MTKKNLFTIICFISCNCLLGQNQYSFTVDEAVVFALENNKNSIYAEKNVLISQKEKWETIAVGLPQISSFFEFNNRIKDPISLIPAEFFGGNEGEFAEISFGTKQSISGELILNQLLFDGSYLIGLQSIELFLQLSSQAKIKTDLEVKRQVINAYGNALVSAERVKILVNNLNNVKKTLIETKKIYENGLTEIENVEQLTITTSSIENSLNYAEKFELLSLNILKLLLGIELSDILILNDNIETIAIKNINPSLVNQEFEISENIDYKIALNASEGNKKRLQLEKFKSLPIFSSLKRTASTQKAKIELDKALLNLKETENTLNLEVEKAKSDYTYSINNYETALKNLTLAESIEKKNKIKFYEGLASSFDLRQAQNQLYSIQNEYLEATLKIIENKINLEILLNKS